MNRGWRSGSRRKPTKSRLEPTAPEFVPSRVAPLDTGVVDGGTHSEGGHEAVQRPPLHDGRSRWEARLTQFEMLAQLSNWSEAQKATYLAVSLRGSALAVLSSLPGERRSDYKSLVTALQNRFGTAHQAELHRMKLRNRTRKRDESLPELTLSALFGWPTWKRHRQCWRFWRRISLWKPSLTRT